MTEEDQRQNLLVSYTGWAAAQQIIANAAADASGATKATLTAVSQALDKGALKLYGPQVIADYKSKIGA